MKASANELLLRTRRAPRMCCLCKEALLSRVTTALEVVGVPSPGFFERHLRVQGSAVLGGDEAYGTKWGHAVIDDALSLLAEAP